MSVSASQTTAAGARTASITPETHPHFYESRPLEFVSVTTPTLIFIGVDDRADFDKIALPLQDSGQNERGHVLVKRLGDFSGDKPTIVFQHWLLSPTTEGYRVINAANTDGAA